MLELLKFIFTSIWHFLGCLVIISLFMDSIVVMWENFWKNYSIRKHGYPPQHFKYDEKDTGEKDEDYLEYN